MKQKQSKGYGVRGTFLLIASIFIMYQAAAIPFDSLNVIVPKFSEMFGWSEATMYLIGSIGGYVSVVFCILFSVMTNKLKNSAWKLSVISLVVLAVVMVAWGHITTLGQFIFVYLVEYIASSAACYYGAQVLIGNWFPRKKGMAMGIITVGQNMSTLSISWLLIFGWNKFGFAGGFNLWTIITLVPLIIIVACLREYPEQCGAYPDNDPTLSQSEVDALLEQADQLTKTSPFTVKKMLKLKQTWIIILACGLLMSATCVVSQLIPAFTSRGYTDTMATVMLTVTGAIAIPTSLFLGWIDQKWGAKKACIVCGITGLIGMLCFALPFSWAIWPAMIGLAFILGTSNNILCSITLTIFGRYDYKNAYGVIFPVYLFLYSGAMWLIAKVAEITGGYTIPFIMLAVLCVIAIILFIIVPDHMIGRETKDIEHLHIDESVL